MNLCGKDTKLNEYKNYRTCPCCGKTLPLTRNYFKRLKTPQGEVGYHLTCKQCEDDARKNRECRDGKLHCHGCGEYKDKEEFSLRGGSDPIRDNRRTLCKDCYTKRQKERNKSLSDDKKLAKCLRWRWLGARDRSTRHPDVEFSITLEDIQDLWVSQDGTCALSGIKMTYELQNGRTPTNVSIDKIDHTKGYVTGNVQLVCMACNQIKSDLSEEDMYQFCKKIVEHYESKNN